MFAVAKQSLKKWKNNLVHCTSQVRVSGRQMYRVWTTDNYRKWRMVVISVYSDESKRKVCVRKRGFLHPRPRTSANRKAETRVCPSNRMVDAPYALKTRFWTEWSRVSDAVHTRSRIGQLYWFRVLFHTAPTPPSPPGGAQIHKRPSLQSAKRSVGHDRRRTGATLSLTTIIPPIILCNGVARRFPGGRGKAPVVYTSRLRIIIRRVYLLTINDRRLRALNSNIDCGV